MIVATTYSKFHSTTSQELEMMMCDDAVHCCCLSKTLKILSLVHSTMPCLILTGHPSSGKTTLAHKLKERALLLHNMPVQVIDDDVVCPDQTKSACYLNAQAEKKTRAALKSAFDRASKYTSTFIILDSLNYIKGFRYELHCISKAAGQKHGVVWVLNDVDVCQEWNRRRSDRYTDEQMQELILRFEPPDARNRWDQPLYRVDMRPPSDATSAASSKAAGRAAQEALDRSVYNMHKLSDAIDQQTDANIDPNRQKVVKKKKSAFRRAAKTTAAATNPETTSPARAKEESIASSSSNEPQTKDSKQSQTVLSIEERVDQILNSFLLDIKPLQEGMSTRQFIATD